LKIEITFEDLSKHLFWDIDVNKLDFQKNKKYIVHRVLDYGLISDWEMIKKYYGINEIARIATGIRDLDKKSASFISLMAKIPKENFLCYITKQSTQKHWNF